MVNGSGGEGLEEGETRIVASGLATVLHFSLDDFPFSFFFAVLEVAQLIVLADEILWWPWWALVDVVILLSAAQSSVGNYTIYFDHLLCV